ncbi:hypothetical protein D3C74_242440 [compost metagenome]
MKKLFIPALLSLLLLFSFTSSALAASVGDQLKQPEESWQRYDDSHDYFKYTGSGWKAITGNSYYFQSTRHESRPSSVEDKINFVFKGTKLRLISCKYPYYSNNLSIKIDGVEETYSLVASEHLHQIVVYEKKGLEDKVHTVEISMKEKGPYDPDFIFDAIDIDSNGELLDPDTTIPDPVDPNPQPTGDRAILTVTMTTGLEKEFDLSMSEVEAFINWYDAKENGTGPAKYGINKYNNNKGPFSKRIDYVIFKNILSFEVSEYSTVTSATYS